MPKGVYERKADWKPYNYKEVTWEVDVSSGCWVCISHRVNVKSGYPEVNRNGKYIKAHRFMYEKYKGEIPKGMFVCHHCDNPKCINPDHLFLGTPKDNTQDMLGKGRHKPPLLRGEETGTSKLTKEQVLNIKSDTRTQKTIAAEYGIRQCHVSRIKRGESWGWLT